MIPLPTFLGAPFQNQLSDAEAKAWNLKANWMLNLDTSRNKQILAVGTQGYVGIYNGTAGGWTRKTQAIDPLHPLQTYEAAYMPSKDTLIVATNDAKMYKSEDAGATFKKIDMAPVFEKWSTTSSKSDLGGRSVIRMAGESCLAECGTWAGHRERIISTRIWSPCSHCAQPPAQANVSIGTWCASVFALRAQSHNSGAPLSTLS
jgi:hypothetical protein